MTYRIGKSTVVCFPHLLAMIAPTANGSLTWICYFCIQDGLFRYMKSMRYYVTLKMILRCTVRPTVDLSHVGSKSFNVVFIPRHGVMIIDLGEHNTIRVEIIL